MGCTVKFERRAFMSGAGLARVTHNFISVTSSSPSSRVCTRSCLGVRVMRYGCGVREDWPLYPSRDMGSSGGDRMSYAQSNREIASHSSRSATWMAGQMRRLRRIQIKMSARKPGLAGKSSVWTTYPAPNAQWSRSIGLRRLLDSAHVSVSPRKRWGLKANLSWGRAHLSASNEVKGRQVGGCVRVWILLLVVMHRVEVENEHCVLRDVHPVVYKIFGGKVWRRRPKRCVDALHLKETDELEN